MELIGPRVLVRRDRAPTHTKEGIAIPETVREHLNSGVIVRAGISFPPAYPQGSVFQAGQRVYFHPFTCIKVPFEGEELWLVDDSSVIAVDERTTQETSHNEPVCADSAH